MKKSFLSSVIGLIALTLASTGYAAAGYLYESDNSTGKIYQFTTTSSGTLIKIEFASGIENVRGLAFDRSGNLFVGQSDRIIKIAPNGFTNIFALNVNGPNSLAFNRAGDLFVTDRDGHVLRFSPQGQGSIFVSGLVKPTGLAFDKDDNLFVADFGSDAIFKVTPEGSRTVFALNMKGPQGLAFDRTGVLYAVNGTNGTIEAFTRVGSRFTRVVNLANPIGLAFDKDNNMFVADSCNGSGTNSIIKFTPTGQTGTTFASGLGCPVQLAFEPPRDPLLNISTRARVEPVLNHELIGGFIVTGTEPKKLLLRALGPSLTKSGNVTNPLLNPILQLHTPDGVVTNDNWMDSQKSEIQSTGLAPSEDLESAILITLNPGTYTAVVRGNAPFVTGIAVVDIFDIGAGSDASLSNISSRGYVQNGDNRMIAGFIVGGGNGAGRILVRGLGPSLAQAGIVDPLPDPTLELRDANGTSLKTNDDWADTQFYEVDATGIPPGSSRESAIVANLVNGAYTAILGDLNGNPGVGLIEVYNLR